MNEFTLFGIKYTKESFLALSNEHPCEAEYNRFMTAKTEEDILEVILDNFNWVNHHILHLYCRAMNFSEGLAPVQKNEKWGYIDKTGKEITHLIYDFTVPFSEGLAGVKKADKWGYINKNGKEVIPLIYDYIWNFSEGLARVKKADKCGYIDKTGEEVIPCIYEHIDYFQEGKAKVQ